jgi:glutamyl-tRNA reductase
MTLLCLGISHHTAPVEIRERLNASSAALQTELNQVSDRADRDLKEFVILSTCNRLEVYALAPTESIPVLVKIIAETSGLPLAEVTAHLYQHSEREAVIHLCRVAGGLDSMILGEPQILGQVTEAYEAALQHGAGPVLSALFRAAIHAGKRARLETAIGRNPATVSSVAVKLAEKSVGDLTSAHVLIVGAGEMAELAVEALRARGTSEITVLNRTPDRAAQLAQRWGGRALTFEQTTHALAEADIVITSTDAPHVLITHALTQTALVQRLERPLVFIDIAVPRDVDPEVGRLPNVSYYDIDDLETHLNGAVAEREREIPRVEALVTEETEKFSAWLRDREVMPVIADLRMRAETIRQAEVEKTLHHLPHLSQAEQQHIEALAEALVNKLLHAPTLRLRAEANNGHAAAYAAAVRYLFGLDDK